MVSMEKDIVENGAGKEWREVPLSWPPCWTCPRDQAWTGVAGAPVFSWGASGFPAGLRSPGQGCAASGEQGKPRWLLQNIPLPRHTQPPHTSLCTTLLLSAHDPAQGGYSRPEQEAKGLQPVLFYTPTCHIDIWEPEDLGGF